MQPRPARPREPDQPHHRIIQHRRAAAVECHVVIEHPAFGRVDAQRVLHDLRGQPDRPTDDPPPACAPSARFGSLRRRRASCPNGAATRARSAAARPRPLAGRLPLWRYRPWSTCLAPDAHERGASSTGPTGAVKAHDAGIGAQGPGASSMTAPFLLHGSDLDHATVRHQRKRLREPVSV